MKSESCSILKLVHFNYHYQKILGKPCFKIKRFQKSIAKKIYYHKWG